MHVFCKTINKHPHVCVVALLEQSMESERGTSMSCQHLKGFASPVTSWYSKAHWSSSNRLVAHSSKELGMPVELDLLIKAQAARRGNFSIVSKQP